MWNISVQWYYSSSSNGTPHFKSKSMLHEDVFLWSSNKRRWDEPQDIISFFSLSPATSPGLAHSVVAFWIKLYPMMMRRQSGKMTAYTRGKLYRKSFMCVYTYKELCMCAYKVLFTKASTSPYTLHITFCDFYKFIMWTFHRQCIGQDNLFV